MVGICLKEGGSWFFGSLQSGFYVLGYGRQVGLPAF